MNNIFRTRHLVHYLLTAKTKYYLHSPFVYHFYLHVLEGNTQTQNIEALRQMLLRSNDVIRFYDWGKGGVYQHRMLKDIVQNSSINTSYGKVLYRLAAYLKPQTILEIGTNLGLGTAYLATGHHHAKVHTIEGSEELQVYAQKNHQQLAINNVIHHLGNFDDVLDGIIQPLDSIDLLFIDGNHHYTPSLSYFHTCLPKLKQNAVVVFDDIYWSPDMQKAWKEIIAHPAVKLSIDIYRMGFVFFRPQQLAKEHFKLLYL